MFVRLPLPIEKFSVGRTVSRTTGSHTEGGQREGERGIDREWHSNKQHFGGWQVRVCVGRKGGLSSDVISHSSPKNVYFRRRGAGLTKQNEASLQGEQRHSAGNRIARRRKWRSEMVALQTRGLWETRGSDSTRAGSRINLLAVTPERGQNRNFLHPTRLRSRSFHQK